MNICFLTYRENNPYIGGIENVTHILSKSFTERGHYVICLSQINSKKEKYIPVCEEFFFPEPSNFKTPKNLQFVISTIKKYNIDIIINQYSKDIQTVELCEEIKSRFPEKKIITQSVNY